MTSKMGSTLASLGARMNVPTHITLSALGLFSNLGDMKASSSEGRQTARKRVKVGHRWSRREGAAMKPEHDVHFDVIESYLSHSILRCIDWLEREMKRSGPRKNGPVRAQTDLLSKRSTALPLKNSIQQTASSTPTFDLILLLRLPLDS